MGKLMVEFCNSPLYPFAENYQFNKSLDGLPDTASQRVHLLISHLVSSLQLFAIPLVSSLQTLLSRRVREEEVVPTTGWDRYSSTSPLSLIFFHQLLSASTRSYIVLQKPQLRRSITIHYFKIFQEIFKNFFQIFKIKISFIKIFICHRLRYLKTS